ncbi:hypothetical protein [Streptomyces scabiei]|uniref:hypothetical protein n=1 Tax=Streptomyces scabiei TaxID=1930 RepID=UPI0029BB6CC5|nr:hypothetical protein [Streptomyces scabiei]MDX3524823.1 hypothetical protein [Streptomyces scabiei]
MADDFRFVTLRAFARPPRLLVVVPSPEAEWVRWAAAGLGALSQVWGGCAGVVLPASVANHPALADAMRRMQPDHVLAYAPSGATVEKIHPGAVDRVVGDLEGEARRQAEAFVRMEPWNHTAAADAEQAAAVLRERLGGNMIRETTQETHLFDDPAKTGLTALTDVATRPVLGAPFPLVSSPSALAYAARVGVDLEAAASKSREPDEARWQEGVMQRADTALLDWLYPSSPQNTLAMLAPEAARCVRLERDRFRAEPVVVLGDSPEDFALAQLAGLVHGPCMWLPWPDPNPLAIASRFPRWRGPGRVRVTSASISLEDVEAHMRTMWDRRPRAFVGGKEVGDKAFECVTVDELRTTGQSLYVHEQAWDLPRSLPATILSDGSLEAALGLPAEVPPGLDATRDKWQVLLVASDHPLPPHRVLTGDALYAERSNLWETFVRAADGGITYSSHRFDFVPQGASLAGTLAAPRLLWPSLPTILALAAKPHPVKPSAAGKRTAVTQRLLGSRAALEDLANGPGWNLLKTFLPGQQHPSQPKDAWWALKTAVVMSFRALAAIPVATEWDTPQRRAQVDEWTRQGVLRRGLALGCQECPAFEFYPLVEIAQHYRCRRCGIVNELIQARWKTDTSEPEWTYELHPAVAELIENNADVPLLATRYLRQQTRGMRPLVGAEFEILRDNAPFVEIDFALATADEIWLGEAKKTAALGSGHRDIKRELCKLLDGCAAVAAHRLILATAAPAWNTATTTVTRRELHGRRVAGRYTPDVYLLTDVGSSAPTLAFLTPAQD